MKIEEICKKYKISKQTWYNWKKEKPELIEAIKKDLNGGITINGNNNVIGHHNKIIINGNDICEEICKHLEKLSEHKQKKLFHKWMGEILEELEKEKK
ncbi:hypothetical protein [Caminibacter mediatlanticus]|uniref:Uncharacterized protein n=1 Tax=Caminibacter mediatlanticus TB-2 TaxID=391592 RepID=A0AAI9AG16_9BACT|nr:hypothetical protein [Caminibacter mediatlanticus]EDM22830.1 hypothetical protein CMTB2_04127 [Caminibacter mediatlanticus TB-2]